MGGGWRPPRRVCLQPVRLARPASRPQAPLAACRRRAGCGVRCAASVKGADLDDAPGSCHAPACDPRSPRVLRRSVRARAAAHNPRARGQRQLAICKCARPQHGWSKKGRWANAQGEGGLKGSRGCGGIGVCCPVKKKKRRAGSEERSSAGQARAGCAARERRGLLWAGGVSPIRLADLSRRVCFLWLWRGSPRWCVPRGSLSAPHWASPSPEAPARLGLWGNRARNKRGRPAEEAIISNPVPCSRLSFAGSLFQASGPPLCL